MLYLFTLEHPKRIIDPSYRGIDHGTAMHHGWCIIYDAWSIVVTQRCITWFIKWSIKTSFCCIMAEPCIMDDASSMMHDQLLLHNNASFFAEKWPIKASLWCIILKGWSIPPMEGCIIFLQKMIDQSFALLHHSIGVIDHSYRVMHQP